MKRQILFFAIIAATLNSCTTAYRSGQTPDDVYYSAARPHDEYVRVEEDDNRYRNDDEYYDDRYLRMKVMNHTRWDYFNDWYSFDRYSYRYNNYYGYNYGSYWNPYNSWNYYYNPYSPNTVILITPTKGSSGVTNIQNPRNFNLNSYTNQQYNNQNNGAKINIKSVPNSRPVYNNNNTGLSNTIKQIFSGGNNNGSYNSYSSPNNRSYSPTSSGSSSNNNSSSSSSTGNPSSGNSSGSGGVTRPTRGGN